MNSTLKKDPNSSDLLKNISGLDLFGNQSSWFRACLEQEIYKISFSKQTPDP
jgi:hypothetical protein